MKSFLHSHVCVILVASLLAFASCFTIAVENQNQETSQQKRPQAPVQSEEFQQWLQVQRERTVQKIMDKIADANDTVMQRDAKIVVARYLVNVTFTAMTRRLEKYGKSLPEAAFISEDVATSTPIPEIAIPEITTSQAELASESVTEVEQVIEEETTQPIPIVEETTFVFQEVPYQNQPLPVHGLTLPASSPNQPSLPVSSPVQAAPTIPETVSIPVIPTIFVVRPGESQSVPVSATDNQTEAATGGPIWQQILTFNFSSIGAGGARLPFNLSLSGATRLPFNLSLAGLRGEGGNRLPFNFTLPTLGGGGGEGGASRLPFNLSLPSLGGEGGARLPFNFSLPTLGGEGGVRLPFNFSLPMPAVLNLLNNNSTNSSEGGEVAVNLPILVLPPPPDFNYPTPPPMNDSVRLSQMYLMTQVDKLVDQINSQNLTGIVDSTVNIATPSTVGVLVNALLNLVLCNPLDRWHGNCGV